MAAFSEKPIGIIYFGKMKTIGLLGGLSWESTALYYQQLNLEIKRKLGGLHSAKLLMYSFDFDEVEQLQSTGNWEKLALLMTEKAQILEKAGAEGIVICSNTMHKTAEAVQKGIQVPIIHLAHATRDAVLRENLRKVGLLGTRFTMEQDFYKRHLTDAGIQVVVPNQLDRDNVHNIIYSELCMGVCKPESKQIYLNIIEHLRREGAEGIILGCTEIPMLIQAQEVEIPIFDTTFIHIQAILQYMLSGNH
jgi:aspartate racemase